MADLAVAWWQEKSVFAFRNSLSLSIAMAALLTFLPPVMFGWRYDTNDDVFLRFIAEGVFSTDPKLNVFMVFSNICLGYALQFFYANAPEIPWYDVFQTTAIFVAIAVSTFSIARCAPTRLVFVVSMICIASLLIAVSTQHQFTLIASCLTGAGFCLLLSIIIVPAHGGLREALICSTAVICLVVGSILRFESFVLCIFACIPALVLCALQSSRFLPWPIIALVVSIGASTFLYQVDRDAYRNDREWTGFREQNNARTNLTEYLRTTVEGRVPSAVLDRLVSSGMSQNDRDLLSNFFFSNSSVFGHDRLVAADRATSESRMSLPLLEDSLAPTFLRLILDWRYAVPFLLIAFTARGWMHVFLSIALCAFAFLTIFTLTMVFKPIPFRVSYGLFYTSTLAAWLSIACTRPLKIGRRGHTVSGFDGLLAAGMAATGLIGAVLLLNSRLSTQNNISRFLDEISKPYIEDVGTITAPRVVIVGGWLPYELLFRPFSGIDLMHRTNLQLTGWIDQTPFQQRSLASRGITDLLLSACEDDQTRIIASKEMLPLFRRYLDEHYSVFPVFTLEPDVRALRIFQCRLDR